jgi:hypothetical protein
VRIRIKKKPSYIDSGDLEGRTFRVGESVDVPARLATLLIVTGCAEPVGPAVGRSEAADAGQRRKKPEPDLT